MAIINRNILFYKALYVPIQSRRISYIITNNQGTPENSSNYKNKLRPSEKNEQTFSGTTDELAHNDTSYDPKTIDPRQEMEKTKHENEDRNPLEWSAANQSISKSTDKRGNQHA
ncbi:6789_t:CDS:2 [Ambispora gerdemannii]|uniref:6789_t:CDS:1 n=1 Tax=Ambispora gerdemannii TaxID=144530 RepID=A0A9N9B8F9_9GLOM|nr:6789_t:CDS:2 [Ambispora gerdemannii]